jgi:hypothetical protein
MNEIKRQLIRGNQVQKKITTTNNLQSNNLQSSEHNLLFIFFNFHAPVNPPMNRPNNKLIVVIMQRGRQPSVKSKKKFIKWLSSIDWYSMRPQNTTLPFGK